MKEKLEILLRDMQDWEKTPTNVPGVKIIRIPENKYAAARLAIEISPVDEKGKPLKKKGSIVISNADLFEKYKIFFENPKVVELINSIDELRKLTPKKDEEEGISTPFEI
ncbi:MAG: hypothetical protein GY870_18530 [archaeon]|nr:hypothetical protein [archaeon]